MSYVPDKPYTAPLSGHPSNFVGTVSLFYCFPPRCAIELGFEPTCPNPSVCIGCLVAPQAQSCSSPAECGRRSRISWNALVPILSIVIEHSVVFFGMAVILLFAPGSEFIRHRPPLILGRDAHFEITERFIIFLPMKVEGCLSPQFSS